MSEIEQRAREAAEKKYAPPPNVALDFPSGWRQSEREAFIAGYLAHAEAERSANP